MTREFVTIAAILLCAGIGVIYFERREVSSKKLVLIAVLAALAALGRVPFAFIPSAQPTTFFVIVSGLVFGPGVGAMVGMLAALVSNMFLGQGSWTLFQMVGWGLCGWSAGCLCGLQLEKHRLALMAFGAAWGFLFGWLLNIWHWYSFVYPLTWSSWIATNAASAWFDFSHALTNVVFLGLFGRDVIRILKRFERKLTWSFVGQEIL